jgi:hypothetical protein
MSSLEIQVKEFEPRTGMELEHSLDVTFSDGNETISTTPQFYEIPADCLPSLDELETWVLNTTRHSRRTVFNSGFHGTCFSLARRYCECGRELPLVSSTFQGGTLEFNGISKPVYILFLLVLL